MSWFRLMTLMEPPTSWVAKWTHTGQFCRIDYVGLLDCTRPLQAPAACVLG